ADAYVPADPGTHTARKASKRRAPPVLLRHTRGALCPCTLETDCGSATELDGSPVLSPLVQPGMDGTWQLESSHKTLPEPHLWVYSKARNPEFRRLQVAALEELSY